MLINDTDSARIIFQTNVIETEHVCSVEQLEKPFSAITLSRFLLFLYVKNVIYYIRFSNKNPIFYLYNHI